MKRNRGNTAFTGRIYALARGRRDEFAPKKVRTERFEEEHPTHASAASRTEPMHRCGEVLIFTAVFRAAAGGC